MASVNAVTDDQTRAEPLAAGTRPYKPGWIDRFTDWVGDLPVPGWLFYAGVWLVLVALETGIKWWDGAYPVGTIFPYHLIVVAGGAVYCLAAIHYLDNVAMAALRIFRPALAVNEGEYADLEYRITTMPTRFTLLWNAAGVLLFVLLWVSFADPGSLALLKLNTSVPASIFEGILNIAQWSTFGALIYHSIHQLSLVSRIYTMATHISLFRLGPLYAFSGLSARTAVAWVGIPYASMISTPGVLGLTSAVVTNIPLTLFAITIFAWPLLGIHRLLEAEKKRLQSEAGEQLEATLAKLHQRLSSDDLVDVPALKNGVEAIIMEQGALTKSRTWPWHLGTVGGLGAALVLPLLLWLLEQVLKQLLGF